MLRRFYATPTSESLHARSACYNPEEPSTSLVPARPGYAGRVWVTEGVAHRSWSAGEVGFVVCKL